MPLTHELLMEALTAISRRQIKLAGQRYTPALNLRITSLFTALENVACGEGARERFQKFLEDLSEAWDRAKYCSQRRNEIQISLRHAHASLADMVSQLRARDTTAEMQWTVRLAELETHLAADMDYWQAAESKLPSPQKDNPYSSELNTVRGNMNAIGLCLTVVREEIEYTSTGAFKVLCDPLLLLMGEWGTGKTHLLCDATLERINRGHATLLVLAKNFQGRVIEEICKQIEEGRTTEAVFDQLQETATSLGERVIVIIDGLNEGRRREWRQAVTTLRKLVATRPGIGLIISCRTPLESLAISQGDLKSLHKITHLGFDDQEFDAQAAFFQHYNLPLPEVPLLDREFSRPLTLKLICQSLQNLAGKKLAQGFAGIASGQKGMTYVLESFVNGVGKPIEDEYGLIPKGCWFLLKGNDQVAYQKHSGFAPCMAKTLRGYVRPSEADRIIAANYPTFSPAQRRNLLEALRINGLIDEDAVWYSSKAGSKSRVVFRLPYQRFSDHLIARHLLKAYLDVSSAHTIRQSFSSKSTLARVFRAASRYQHEYAEPGWAQALITEFPERVGAKLPEKERELFFSLPSKSKNLSAYFEPFIEGLFWRDPASFTEGTRLILNKYLNANKDYVKERVIDALVAISTKPKHPYHARRLYEYLSRHSMPDRDLTWTEYLRRRHASPTIQRLLAWAENLGAASLPEESAKELIVLLSLVLTTVVRKDRDLVTKALVIVGEKYPEKLFEHVIASQGFSDPYLSERMLAAAYGVTLSLVDSEKCATFRVALGTLAKNLYDSMFGTGARYATHHVLKRDYALGIIEVAQSMKCVTLPTTAGRNLTPPYPHTPSTFTSAPAHDPAITEAIGHAIRMDFENYTIGRLIPHRANHIHKTPGEIRDQIERRMFDLGYREKLFGSIDRAIGSSSFNVRDEHKVDRYGKKYSWIAYFEMWGELEATKALPEWRFGERTSDCGVDPSFPKRPPVWTPPIPDLFGDLSVRTEAWVESGFTPTWSPLLVVPEINGQHGEWVLIEGFVNGVREDLDRELFAFLRGAFVKRRDVRSLSDKFMSVGYPGNDEIPDGAKEVYLFAGEAGRRSNYARHLLQRNGRYRRQVVEAFDRWDTIETEEEPSSISVEFNIISPAGEKTGGLSKEYVIPATKTQHVPGFRIELPSIHFGWESYHSAHNTFSGFDLPAPSLLQRLGLASRNREIDFYDKDGKPATLYREAGDPWKGNRHRLLYVRADLLQRYLTETRQVLVWFNWGERDWLKKMEDLELIDDDSRRKIYQAYRHIHRSFSQWRA